jgi:hypothetical protein
MYVHCTCMALSIIIYTLTTHTHTYSLAAPCSSTVPDSLVPGLALLCLGSLVAMETLRPPLPLPSSLVHPLIPVCSNEIETLFRSSDSVLKELLGLFHSKEIIIGNKTIISRRLYFLTKLNFCEEYRFALSIFQSAQQLSIELESIVCTIIITNYRIVGNFCGRPVFKVFIFADASDHAHYTLYNRAYFTGLNFKDSRKPQKLDPTKIFHYSAFNL